MTTYINLGNNGTPRQADRVLLMELGLLNKKIAANPGDCEAWISRGHLHLSPFLADRGKRGRALADFEQAIGLEPENSEAWRGKGRALFVGGQYNEAIQAFTKAVELGGNNVLAFLCRGICYMRIGDQIAARPDLEKSSEAVDYPEAGRFASLLLENT